MSKCRICGRPLSAPSSIAAGIGPVCSGRNYKGRIHARYGSTIGGWSQIEEWEKVNHPCYSCKFFEFPSKGNEHETLTGFTVEMHGLVADFDKKAIGGFCKKLKTLVDGNFINNESACLGVKYNSRKDSSEQPEVGLLKTIDGQIELFKI